MKMIYGFLALLHILHAGTPTVGVEEVLTIGERQDDELYSIGGVAVDDEGNIYVSDVMDYSVKKFDPTGSYVGKAGRRGSGPGEFRAPATCAIWNDTLAVMEMNSPQVQIFAASTLGYLGNIHVDAGVPIDLAFNGHGQLYVALLREGPQPGMMICDQALWMHQRSVLLSGTGKENMLYNACRIAMTREGELIVAYTFVNRFDICSPDGKPLRSLSIPGIRSFSSEGTGASVPRETFVRSLVVDSTGKIWFLGGSAFSHEGQDVWILSEDGVVLFTLQLPHKSRTLTVDRRGYLYGTADDGTLLKKYKVIAH